LGVVGLDGAAAAGFCSAAGGLGGVELAQVRAQSTAIGQRCEALLDGDFAFEEPTRLPPAVVGLMPIHLRGAADCSRWRCLRRTAARLCGVGWCTNASASTSASTSA